MPKKLLDANPGSAARACYCKALFKTELDRLEYLFGLYKELTKDLFIGEKSRRGEEKKKKS